MCHIDAQEPSAAVRRGGGGSRGYTCKNGSCECDKSIENDCEDMSGVCTDATVDALINCINGWLTTHCSCTKALKVRGTRPGRVIGTGGVLGTGGVSGTGGVLVKGGGLGTVGVLLTR